MSSIDREQLGRMIAEVGDAQAGTTLLSRLDAFASATRAAVPRSSLGIVVFDATTFAPPAPDRVLLEAYPMDTMLEYGAHYRFADPFANASPAPDEVHLISRFIPDQAWGKDEFTADWCDRRAHLRWGVASALTLGDGMLAHVNCFRDRSMDDFSADEARAMRLILPTLRRAIDDALIAETLAGGPAPAGRTRLEGVALVDSGGTVIRATPFARESLHALGSQALLHLLGSSNETCCQLPTGRFVRLTLSRSAREASFVIHVREVEPGTKQHAQAVMLGRGLTPREAQVSWLVSSGLTNRLVAAQLGSSALTVKGQLSAAMRKLGVRDRLALMLALRGTKAPTPER